MKGVSKVIDSKNPWFGITELRYIDPLKIKKVREVDKRLSKDASHEEVKGIEEYYIYNEAGISPIFGGGGIAHGPKGELNYKMNPNLVQQLQNYNASMSYLNYMAKILLLLRTVPSRSLK